MNTSKKIVVAAVAGLMATTSLGSITAYAAGSDATTAEKAPDAKNATGDAVESATDETAIDAEKAKVEATKSTSDAKATYATQKTLLKTADEALATLTHVHAARMALFDNDMDVAKAEVTKATKALTEGETDLTALHVADTEKTDTKAEYLPFDMSMMLSSTFQPTKESKAALEKANAQMQGGDQDSAIETLRIASVDLNISAALLPDASSMETLKQASKLIDDRDYFEANLALKSIEDSVIVRTFGIDAIPAQGNAG